MNEIEVEKEKQSNMVMKSLAELNLLNKEMKSMNKEYFEVGKKFEVTFRRYMQRYGKKGISSTDINIFNEVIKDRKHIDYSADVNSTLGNPFIRFMRNNFSSIKSQELEYYTELKSMKDKAEKISSLGLPNKVEKETDDDKEYRSDYSESEDKERNHDSYQSAKNLPPDHNKLNGDTNVKNDKSLSQKIPLKPPTSQSIIPSKETQIKLVSSSKEIDSISVENPLKDNTENQIRRNTNDLNSSDRSSSEEIKKTDPEVFVESIKIHRSKGSEEE